MEAVQCLEVEVVQCLEVEAVQCLEVGAVRCLEVAEAFGWAAKHQEVEHELQQEVRT